MDDEKIVQLYFDRSEQAVEETASKYGSYCYSIAYNILDNNEDAQECVNDTYIDAWNSMPPHRPSILATFLGKITRRISIDRWRRRNAVKRGGGQMPLVLEELDDCVAGEMSVEQELERRWLSELIDSFVRALPETEQKVFLCRYWYLDSVDQIGRRFGFSETKVRSMLFRTRGKLRDVLSREGFR